MRGTKVYATQSFTGNRIGILTQKTHKWVKELMFEEIPRLPDGSADWEAIKKIAKTDGYDLDVIITV